MTAVLVAVVALGALVTALRLVAGGGPAAVASRARAARAWLAEGHDGRAERRDAERTARELLRTCLDLESWEMYRDLGFVRVWGTLGRAPAPAGRRPAPGVAYAYLVYPHRPHVVYLPQTTTLLGECAVELAGSTAEELAPSDDLLAHWMALTGDEPGVVAAAHIATPGSDLSRRAVRRDLWRLREWERERAERYAAVVRAARLDAPADGRTA
ncbi:hypothetical protein [Patulibacter sp. SYSU D01012]|uniref:hypothetical protein n=1 Tax=Patulibacter sp. SYSU D01012 TaxID=2817381 RepID=UPI001B3076CE|nr:hypothetical protein [Patulibacter sp. SYSU D01012]